MPSFLKNFPIKKTLLISGVVLIILDVLSSLYFVEYWRAQHLSERFLSLALLAQGGALQEVDPHFLNELRNMIENTGGFMLMIFLLINTFFYFYLVFQKKWAWQYVVTYTSTAALFCLVTAFESPSVGSFYTLYNIIAIFLYALLSFVLWQRKLEVQDTGFKMRNGEQ